MEILTPIQKLDRVLTFMAGKNYIVKQDIDLYKSIEHVFIDLKIADGSVNINDVVMILDKLVKDGWVNIPQGITFPLAKQEVYSISFEGKFFFEQGGYKQQLKDKRAKRNRDTAFTLSVGIGTALAGIYGLAEIIKLLSNHFFHCR